MYMYLIVKHMKKRADVIGFGDNSNETMETWNGASACHGKGSMR